MHAAEITCLSHIGANSFLYFLSDLVRLTCQLFGAIFRNLRNGWLSRIPIPCAVLIKVRRCRCETAKRIPENSGCFTGHYATQSDSPILNTTMCRSGSRCRAQVDSSRDSTARCVFAEILHFAIETERQSARPVHVFLNYRNPVVRKIPR